MDKIYKEVHDYRLKLAIEGPPILEDSPFLVKAVEDYRKEYESTTIYKKRNSNNIRNRRVLKRIKRRSWYVMLKRIVMLIVLGLMFSSCDFIHYGKIAVYENKLRSERERGIK